MLVRSHRIILAAVLCIFLAAAQLIAQKTPVYPVTDIPHELLEDSKAVIREDITRYEIIDKGTGKKYTKSVVTILNKKADDFAEVRLSYSSSLDKITSIEGRVMDKYGKVIRTVKKKDIEDYASFDGYSIYSDLRMKYIDLRYPEYPYTIELEIEEEDDGLFVTPGWIPYSGFNIASQQSELVIKCPTNYKLRYMELNMEPAVIKESGEGQDIYKWKFGAFPAIERESRMPSLSKIIPRVLTAPSEFEMEGYEGDMSSWSSFGAWEQLLNAGRDELPMEFTEELKSIVSNSDGRTAKIRKLYSYLQQHTRYVSIQLGIGGWQTFPAVDVANNGYGDCKALSNYMKAMLKAVDIDSYYTLVKAGRGARDINVKFPSNQFNHMILCVPNYQDTIWLECTSQDNPFGYLGSFTGDRHVLVINEEGGSIVRTHTYGKNDNTQFQHFLVKLSDEGKADLSMNYVSSGLQYDRFSGLLDIGEKDQKEWLYKHLDLTDFRLVEFEFSANKNPMPKMNAKLDLSMSRYASVSGKRLFFQPNIMNKAGKVSIPQKERKYDFELSYPFVDADTVEIEIPDGFHMEYIPEEKVIKSQFGAYESKVIGTQGKIKYIRIHSMEAGTFKAEEYQDYVEFRNKVAEADKMKIVLVKST